MTIQEIIAARKIEEVVHFTSNHGLVGTLEVGAVLSRRQLPEFSHLAHLAAPTSAQRQEAMSFFNKEEDWLDYINLSLSQINRRYFAVASTKWHVLGDRWWTILAFCPSILADPGVYFTTTNNVYDHVKRGQGAEGLNALFAARVPRKGDWHADRNARIENLATCEQAEVLYPGRLSIENLTRIYVDTGEQHDIVSGWLRLYRRTGISVVVDPSKFIGSPN